MDDDLLMFISLINLIVKNKMALKKGRMLVRLLSSAGTGFHYQA